jgi:hypothetical protein
LDSAINPIELNFKMVNVVGLWQKGYIFRKKEDDREQVIMRDDGPDLEAKRSAIEQKS